MELLKESESDPPRSVYLRVMWTCSVSRSYFCYHFATGLSYKGRDQEGKQGREMQENQSSFPSWSM